MIDDKSELGAIFDKKLVLANIDKNEIDFSEFKRIEGGELTGEGNGIVNKYYWKTEKIDVVLKSESNWGPKDKSTFHREFKILASLKKKHEIVKMKAIHTIAKQGYMQKLRREKQNFKKENEDRHEAEPLLQNTAASIYGGKSIPEEAERRTQDIA